MKVVKGLVLSLLSFLLFLSITVLGIGFTLKSTLLSPDFMASEVDKIDVSTVVKEVVDEQISEHLPQELGFVKEAVYSVISAHEPWLKEQINAAVYSFYDFLLGKTERLSVEISLEPLKESLRDTLLQTFMQSLPPQLALLPQPQIEQYFDQYYQQLAGQIPSSFELDESVMPPEVMLQIMQVREGINHFLICYNLFIVFTVVLVLCIIIIHRRVRNISRELGIILLTYGVFEFGGVLLARNFMPTQLPMMSQIPPSLQTWVLGLVSDILMPLQMFSLGCLAGGMVLLVVSFVYKPREAEE